MSLAQIYDEGWGSLVRDPFAKADPLLREDAKFVSEAANVLSTDGELSFGGRRIQVSLELSHVHAV